MCGQGEACPHRHPQPVSRAMLYLFPSLRLLVTKERYAVPHTRITCNCLDTACFGRHRKCRTPPRHLLLRLGAQSIGESRLGDGFLQVFEFKIRQAPPAHEQPAVPSIGAGLDGHLLVPPTCCWYRSVKHTTECQLQLQRQAHVTLLECIEPHLPIVHSRPPTHSSVCLRRCAALLLLCR